MPITQDVIRRLTIFARSEGVDKVQRDLAGVAAGQAKVAQSGRVAATATDSLSRRQISAATAYSRLRSSFDATFRAQMNVERGERTLQRAFDQGVIDATERARAQDLLRQKYDMTAAAMVRATSRATTQSRQLMFQLVDIGQAIPLAFQSPIYAVQNLGFQIAQIGQLYAGQGGMKQALIDATGQVSRFAGKIGPLALVVGGAAAAIAGMRAEINRTADVTVSFGDVALGVWQSIRDGIATVLRPAVAAIAPWFAEQWNTLVADVKAVGNEIIGVFVGSYSFITSVWSNLGPAFTGFAKQAVNGLIEEFSNLQILQNPFTGKTMLQGPDLTGFKRALTEAESSAVSGARGSFGDAFGRDYMGEFFSSVRGNALQNARDRLGEVESAAGKAGKALDKAANDNVAGWDRLSDTMEAAKGTLNGFLSDFRQGLAQGEGVFKAFGNALTNVIDKIADRIQTNLVDALFKANQYGGGGGFLGAFGSLFGIGAGPAYYSGALSGAGLFAHGAAFHGGNVVPFARGGIVERPTLFPMAKGMGLMGEAGPEAVMPLRRMPSGRLGVETAGGGAPQINLTVVNAYGPDAEVRARQTGPTGRDIEIMIDRKVESGLIGGRYDKAMGARYGSRPQLAGAVR